MLTICCGDDSVSSRRAFAKLKIDSLAKGDVVDVGSDTQKLMQGIEHSSPLFSDKTTYFLENVSSKKGNRDIVQKYTSQPNCDIVLWEGQLEERFIKLYYKSAHILSFKLPSTIWKFLDSLAPGSLQKSLRLLDDVAQTVDENMLLFMTQRRLKDLIMIATHVSSKRKLAPWQAQQLSMQSGRWSRDKLYECYRKLYTIETGIKSGTIAYPIKSALDITLSFYVR